MVSVVKTRCMKGAGYVVCTGGGKLNADEVLLDQYELMRSLQLPRYRWKYECNMKMDVKYIKFEVTVLVNN